MRNHLVKITITLFLLLIDPAHAAPIDRAVLASSQTYLNNNIPTLL